MDDIFAVTRADAATLLAAAQTNWNRPVPHCPEWDQAQLVRHTGEVLAWMAAVVTTRTQLSRRAMDPAPSEPAALPDWFRQHLDQTLRLLATTDPQTPTWTFSGLGDHRVAWWRRRIAVEVAIHRWDAQHAAEPTELPPVLDAEVAAAGVGEFLTEFLPGMLTRMDGPRLAGTVHLHATDGPLEWIFDLDSNGPAIAEHRRADTAVRGTRSDLLLWLTNRRSPDALEIIGSAENVNRWAQLRR